MKTLLIILLFSLSVSAQGIMVPGWLTSAADEAVSEQFFNNVEVLGDHIFIQVERGDRIVLWDNSGFKLLDKTFDTAQEYELSMGFYLAGTYHLGVKKQGSEGWHKTINLKGGLPANSSIALR